MNYPLSIVIPPSLAVNSLMGRRDIVYTIPRRCATSWRCSAPASAAVNARGAPHAKGGCSPASGKWYLAGRFPARDGQGGSAGCLVLDDSVHSKPKGREMAGLGRHYSTTEKKAVSPESPCFRGVLWVGVERMYPPGLRRRLRAFQRPFLGVPRRGSGSAGGPGRPMDDMSIWAYHILHL
jgi:hypothetical protein